MHKLNFSLNLEGVVKIHDAVLCLAKFGEVVSLEARSSKLTLTALNSSKSAYASFSFDKNVFFETYTFGPSLTEARRPAEVENIRTFFTCQLYNKALLHVFKGRLGDAKDKDTAVERCECSIKEQPDITACRLVVKMICRHGVIKTYKLTYESVEVLHALFNREAANNTWTVGANTLKSLVEYFGASTEFLDISAEDEKATFTSYTEKVTNGRDILKQPLQTSVTVDNLEFDKFDVEEQLHVGISVKDFKAIVNHAETLNTSITASYSFPNRPLQLSYYDPGMQCEFTLMTIGDFRSGSAPPAPAPARKSSNMSVENPREPSIHDPSAKRNRKRTAEMPPPAEPASRSFTRDLRSQKVQRASPPPPKASLDPDSLFMHVEDEDRIWGERAFNAEEDVLGWNASANNEIASVRHDTHTEGVTASKLAPYPGYSEDTNTSLEPTQRISQVQGLFTDS